MHADAIRRLLYGLCFCTGDNLLAKSSGLSSHIGAQPNNNLHKGICLFGCGPVAIMTA